MHSKTGETQRRSMILSLEKKLNFDLVLTQKVLMVSFHANWSLTELTFPS